MLNEIQDPHVLFFTLLVMLGNYEPLYTVNINGNNENHGQ